MKSLLLLVIFLVSSNLHGQNWPQFRGTNALGSSTPTGGTENPNIIWKIERGGPYTPTPLAYGDISTPYRTMGC